MKPQIRRLLSIPIFVIHIILSATIIIPITYLVITGKDFVKLIDEISKRFEL